jgi:uncharacterized membrane protein YedE/YeeE
LVQSTAPAVAAIRENGVHPQTAAGILLLIGVGVLIIIGSRGDPEVGLFGTIGIALGITLQRSRFCFNSAFRDLVQFRSGRTMKGVIIGLAVAAGGFGLRMYNLLPNPSLGAIAPEAHATPLSSALIIGGVLFGIGMVLAGGCTSGSIYRMGEGYVASWVSFAGILGGLLLGSYSWNWWWRHAIRGAPVVWFPRYLGYGGALALTLAALLAAYLVVLWIESMGGVGVQESTPPVAEASFPEKVRALVQRVFVRGWPAAVGGALLGLLNTFSYDVHMPWRIVGELSRWINGAAGLVGLAPGPLEGTDQLTGCTLSIGGGILSHTFLLTVGTFGGSLLAALLAHEFRLRIPRNPIRYAQSLVGGLMMGYGSALALGCTVGAFFSAIPSLALNGWVFALTLMMGAMIGLQVIERIP